MTTSDLSRTIATLVLTIVTSATLVAGAIGPAQADAGKTTVVTATRLVA